MHKTSMVFGIMLSFVSQTEWELEMARFARL